MDDRNRARVGLGCQVTEGLHATSPAVRVRLRVGWRGFALAGRGDSM